MNALILLVPQILLASDFPRVDAEVTAYDEKVATLQAEFALVPGDVADKGWVRAKITHMREVDQLLRIFGLNLPAEKQFTDAERQEFWNQIVPRMQSVDQANTTDLKALLARYRWFKISEFGSQADQDAWLLVQHADLDPDFQRQLLPVLEELYPMGETRPDNYAYLFDRVAASWSDPAKRVPQRYGTQGSCVAKGKWEPLPLEELELLDARRARVGLGPEAEYVSRMNELCVY